LRKTRSYNVFIFDGVNILDIVLNSTEIRLRSNLISSNSSNNKSIMISMNKVGYDFRLNILKSLIDVSDMLAK